MKLIFGLLLVISVWSFNEAHACGEKAGLSYLGKYKIVAHLANKNLDCHFEGNPTKGFIQMKNEKCGGWITYVSLKAFDEVFAVRNILKKEKQEKYLVETIDEHSPALICSIAK